ncbi:hypothetical protein LTR53_019136, partial [Teratosphaeriaceae sp. CCFEE 6253]
RELPVRGGEPLLRRPQRLRGRAEDHARRRLPLPRRAGLRSRRPETTRLRRRLGRARIRAGAEREGESRDPRHGAGAQAGLAQPRRAHGPLRLLHQRGLRLPRLPHPRALGQRQVPPARHLAAIPRRRRGRGGGDGLHGPAPAAREGHGALPARRAAEPGGPGPGHR